MYCRHHFMIIVTFPTYTMKNSDHLILSQQYPTSPRSLFWEDNQVIQSTRSNMMHRAQANAPTAGKLDSLRNIAQISRSSYFCTGLPKCLEASLSTSFHVMQSSPLSVGSIFISVLDLGFLERVSVE